MEFTKRDTGFDALRGVAILGVVLIHSTRSGYVWQQTAEGAGNFYYTIFFRQFLNFSIPAFLFLSGYFAARSAAAQTGYIMVTKKRLMRVLIPYLVWSVAVLTISGLLSGKISIKIFLFKLFTGGALGPYYFVPLICQYYVLTPVLMHINKQKNGFYTILSINLLVLLAFYVVRTVFLIDIPSFLYILPFYSWVIFYQYGLLVGADSTLEGRITRMPGLFAILAIVGLLLSCTEAILMLRYFDNINYAATSIKLSSYIYAMSVISLFLWLKTRIAKWYRLLLLIGNYSFGIYLIHILFLERIVPLLSHFKILNFLQPIFQIVTALLTTMMCIGCIYMSRRIFTERLSVKILGL